MRNIFFKICNKLENTQAQDSVSTNSFLATVEEQFSQLCIISAKPTTSICGNTTIMTSWNKKCCIQFTHLFCEFAPFLLPLFVIWKVSSLDLPNTEFRLLNFLLPGFILLAAKPFRILSQQIAIQETYWILLKR